MRALVTGGGGFLGGAIVRKLVERGWPVRTLQRGSYPGLEQLGVEQVQGDIANQSAVDRAAAGCDVVFHVAAKVRMWGRYDEFHRINVEGTENVVASMERNEVSKLVYTSTPSVVHGGRSIEGADETLPYPARFESPYPRSKAAAERVVLAANGPRLATLALRPHLIWGPGDTNLVPQVVARAKAGRLRFVGGGENLVDTLYIDNAVDAHVLAADRLSPGAACAGRAYFVTNGEPRALKDVINGILIAAGLAPETRSLPLAAALVAGAVMETIHRLLPGDDDPVMTRFIARNLATAHWYDISAAKRDLGYEPRVSLDEGFRRLHDWFQSQRSRVM